MPKLVRVFALTLLLLSSRTVAVHAGPSGPGRPAAPASTDIDDASQRIDVNRLAMRVKNTGSFAWDVNTGSAGLEYPIGTGKTAVYAAGLWLGTFAASSGARVSVAEYSEDFRPGAAPGGSPEDPAAPELKVYKLQRQYASTAVRDAALADYIAGAVPRGAPPVPVLPDGSLGILGDQMLWSVFNDLGKGAAHNGSSSARPLGVEVQQTTWGFDRPAPAGEVVFTRFRIINRSASTLAALHVALWADPDLGEATDDLIGCDPDLSLGYCYNATNNDLVYGTAPPAVGFDLMRAPSRAPALFPMRAFHAYVNGTGPQDSTESYRVMQGLLENGSVMVDPVTLLPTTFQLPGDPVAGTGWIDGSPGDRRLMLTSGAFDLPSGQADEAVFAVLVAQGSHRLDSVTRLKQQDQVLQAAFDVDAVGLLAVPAPPARGLALSAPRPNPARGAFELSFTLASAGEARVDLLDLAGRAVAGRALGSLAAGSHTVRLDESGTDLPAGLYFVRLTHRDGQAVRRIALVR
ncbi:MAG: T9SS type A sorting domain-containing protein [Candidatus Eisenbacteria bacterium]